MMYMYTILHKVYAMLHDVYMDYGIYMDAGFYMENRVNSPKRTCLGLLSDSRRIEPPVPISMEKSRFPRLTF